MSEARFYRAAVLSLLPLLLSPHLVDAASLAPSRSGLMRQVRQARSHGYTHLQNEGQVRDFVARGLLVRLPGNSDYEVKATVPFPYARPEVELFVERLSAQYRQACGEKLVVTSLTRPKNRQPRNSSPLSVHPTGMAMDLRVSWRRSCRSWLERTLLGLESSGVLEAARERYPPHYHVVLFPQPYVDYLETRLGVHAELPPGTEESRPFEYRVRRGDNLWRIARRHGTTVYRLKTANGIRSNLLRPGQVLHIPAE